MTDLERGVLKLLYESAKKHDHKFGYIEDARPAVETPRQLSGVMTALSKKDVVVVDEHEGKQTRFKWGPMAMSMTQQLGLR